MVSLILRDAVTATNIPRDTPAVAGYIDGIYVWSLADWALFPSAAKITIAVHPEHAADALDVESGDAVPGDIPGWIARFNQPARRAPTIYCSRSAWPACKAVVGEVRVDWWISTLDGTTDVPGAAVVQYETNGRYDESLILDPGWIATEVPDVATIGQKRATIFNFRVSAFGEWPPDQASVDAYAQKIADDYGNVEAVLTELLDVYKANGGKPLWRAQIPPPM